MNLIYDHYPFSGNIPVWYIIIVFVAVGLQIWIHVSLLQAYADYMGFVLTLNEGVKGKKLTCEYKVSEVCRLSY